jgi:hypothetical protein
VPYQNGARPTPAIADSEPRVGVVPAGEPDGHLSKPILNEVKTPDKITGKPYQAGRERDVVSAPPSYIGSKLDEPDFCKYVLAELRCAALRARLAACDIDAIGIALVGGWIGPRDAIEAIADAGAIDYLEPTPPADSAVP